ncbi:MAG: hypothetical protein LBB85_11700 [Dysgonamonadaceae bacterium]|jgi:hypothetical protein|nr:hypothetical protein [Dysgonamonadaceae bacterium]
MIIAVDFDGTLHTGEYPAIGAPAPYAAEIMQQLAEDGHYIIIWTCREGDYQTDMVNWLVEHKIPFNRVNNHAPGVVKKYGFASRKIFADVYIDDRQIGGLPTWHEIYDIVSGKVKPVWFYEK